MFRFDPFYPDFARCDFESVPMDCWRISRSHRLRGARTFGTTFSSGFEKKDVSFAISFSRMQPQQDAAAISLRSRRVAALKPCVLKKVATVFREERSVLGESNQSAVTTTLPSSSSTRS